jgi:hypothetical protein
MVSIFWRLSLAVINVGQYNIKNKINKKKKKKKKKKLL